jgi:hypothetical protein
MTDPIRAVAVRKVRGLPEDADILRELTDGSAGPLG